MKLISCFLLLARAGLFTIALLLSLLTTSQSAKAQGVPFAIGQYLYNPNNTTDPSGDLQAAALSPGGPIDLFSQASFPGVYVFTNQGGGNFTAPTVIVVGNLLTTEINFIRVLDLSGNGQPDLVVTAIEGVSPVPNGFLYIFPNNGNGTFATPSIIPINEGEPGEIEAADFNGDGKIDLAISLANGTATFDVLLGNGDGTFQKAVPYGQGNDGEMLAGVADMTNHGSFDLLALTRATTFLWRGNGDGTFQSPIALPPPASAFSNAIFPTLKIADFNYDNFLDLTIDNSSGEVLNNGDGTFRLLPGGADAPVLTTFADFNGDGKLDMFEAAGSEIEQAGSSPTTLFNGNGDGSFQTGIQFTVPGENLTDPITADLYGHDRPDAAFYDFQFERGEAFDFAGFLVLENTLPTGVAVSSSQNPALVGNPITFTAGVNTSIAGTLTGTVTFLDGQNILGTVPLDNTGHASITPTFLDIGNHTIRAEFDGGTQFGTVFSTPIYQEVFGKSPGPLTLVSSANPVVDNQPISLTASLSGTLNPTPTGTITFYDDDVPMGTLPIGGSNQAVLPATFSTPGNYTLTAVYSGDRHYTGVSSAPLTQVVTAPGSPTISGMTPNNAQEGSPDLTVTVQGSGFTNGCVVLAKGNALATTFVDAAHLTAVIPASDLADEGTFLVTVNNPTLQETSPSFTFTVTDAPLKAAGMTFNAMANIPYNGPIATFTDGNANAPTSDFTGTTINWGDGDVAPATVTANGGGKFTVNGSHVYTAVGTDKVIVAIVDVGGSKASVNSTATVAPGAPVAPVLGAFAVNPTTIDLVWSASSGTVTYDIERMTTGAFSQITTVNGSTTTYTDSGLTPGTSYTYRVRAVNGLGTSPYSNNATATTFTSLLTTFPAGLQMISLPYSYAGTTADAASILGLTIGQGGTAPIATWNPMSANYLLYPKLPVVGNQTLAGVGYWIDEPQTTPFFAAGVVVTSPFSEALQPGWNIIGDPFTNPIIWSNAQFTVPFIVANQPPGTKLTLAQMRTARIIDQPLFDYDTSTHDYAEATSLQPYLGDWVFVDPNFSNNQAITLWLTNPGP